MVLVLPLAYLFKHSLGVGYPCGFLPTPAVGQVLPRCQLVHGHHGTRGLLSAQLQHREQVEGYRAHVGQGSNLE